MSSASRGLEVNFSTSRALERCYHRCVLSFQKTSSPSAEMEAEHRSSPAPRRQRSQELALPRTLDHGRITHEKEPAPDLIATPNAPPPRNMDGN
jgi:hypothetical protein